LKFIVQPVNLAIPVPIKGPKDAQTIGSFFGSKNIRFARGVFDGIDCRLVPVLVLEADVPQGQ